LVLLLRVWSLVVVVVVVKVKKDIKK